MSLTILKKVNEKYAALIGFGLWCLGLIISMIIMGVFGIDPQEETFGLDHEKYWEFEIIMTPSFIIFGLLGLFYYFKKSEIPADIWITEALVTGAIIMVIQFVMDLFVIVLLFNNELDYFVGLVTISYLLIPIWSLLVGYYVRVISES